MSLTRLPFAALLLASVAALAPPPAAQAAAVFDSGVEAGEIDGAVNAYPGANELATQFAVAVDVTVGGATLIGTSSAPGAFTLSFYQTATGLPQTTPTHRVTATSWTETAAGGYTSYALSFSTVTLTAGTWWFSAVADSEWAWGRDAHVTTSPIAYRQAGDGNGWGGYNGTMAFSLEEADASAVPLPAALPLLGAGVAGLALIARRRKA